jgi:hypothetical protein
VFLVFLPVSPLVCSNQILKTPIPIHADEEDRNAEPNKVDTVLAAAQVNAYCDQIASFSKEGFSKLFLVGSLHKEAGAAALDEAAAAAGLPAAAPAGGGAKSN